MRRRRDQLRWLHTIESTDRLWRLVASGRATIQKLTVAFRGGRWQAAFQLRYRHAPPQRTVKHLGVLIALDIGVRHLATTSEPVPGLTDHQGHIPNPKILEAYLRRLRRLDRALSLANRRSKNRKELVRRRARLHGRIAKTRALWLHSLTTTLAGAYDVVAVEDLNVKGIANKKRHLGRKVADAALGELRRQLTYKTADRGHTLVVVGRFYPSSKTCSSCGKAKATLSLSARVFRCEHCGYVADRDVNAARNIANEAIRLLDKQRDQEESSTSPGYDGETLNADRSPRQTREAQADLAAVA